ncbi:RNA polymerase subunit sigma-70, partial [Dysosmobacter welbionis]
PRPGHLQRLPGPHQAGAGPLRRNPGHRCRLPHADLQCHRPPPVPDRPDPGGLQPVPLADQGPGGGHRQRPHLPRGRAVPLPAGSLGTVGGKRPDRHPVRGSGRPSHHGYRRQPQRLRLVGRGHHLTR